MKTFSFTSRSGRVYDVEYDTIGGYDRIVKSVYCPRSDIELTHNPDQSWDDFESGARFNIIRNAFSKGFIIQEYTIITLELEAGSEGSK